MEKLAYGISELSELTGISRRKIYSEINLGKLKATKIGTRTVILRRHVDEWLAGCPALTASL